MYRRIYYDGSKIYLWETLPDGKNVKEVIDHEIEYYIPDETKQSPITDIFGNPVIKQTSKSKRAVMELVGTGIKCCETDLSETIKFLQKRYANVNLKPDISIFKIGILDIEVESGGEFPYPNEAKFPINLITIRNLKTLKTYTFGNRPYTGNNKTVENYICCKDEKELLTLFVEFFRRCSFDIITGWNVLDFDIRYINNRLRFNGIEKTLSPIDNVYEDKDGNITIAGLCVLDYQQMYREFLKIPMSSYSLHFVCLYEIGEGKLELEGSINNAYLRDWNGFVEYNINDVVLVHKLDTKLKLILLCITLAYQTLIPFEKTLSTIPLVEGMLLKSLHKKNMVMNDRRNEEREEYVGGYVESQPGFYYDVLSFDVESMYPHLMMAFNISPETLVLNPENPVGLIHSPVKGVYFKKDREGFLPQVVRTTFTERKEFKNRMKIYNLYKKELSPEDIASRLHMDILYVNNEIDIIKSEKETVEYYDLQQYVRKILANCFHKDTEILTVDGIKNIQDINIGDMVYSINSITQKLEIKEVECINKEWYSGNLNRIKNTIIDECITPEHRMVTQNTKDKKISFIKSKDFINRCVNKIPIHYIENKKTDEYVYITDFLNIDKYEGLLWYPESDLRYVKRNLTLVSDVCLKQIKSRKHTALITNGFTRENIKILYKYGYDIFIRPKGNRQCSMQKVKIRTDSLSKFIGFYLSEGNLYKSAEKKYKTTVRGISKIISMTQYVSVNPKIYKEINMVMTDVLISEHINCSSLYYHKKGISVSSYVMYDFILNNFGSLHNKHIYSNIINKLNKKLIFECMYKGDGDKRQFRYTITTKNKQLFNDTMMLMLELGYMPRYKIENGKYPVYRLMRNNRSFYIRKNNCSKEKYHDYVYCLTVKDNHTVCAGMNGKFAWTGQSMYGVLANPYFHFCNINNAKAVTIGGQTLIRHLASEINLFLRNKYALKNNPVIVIDTDSCYLQMKEVTDKQKIFLTSNAHKIEYFLNFINTELTPVIDKSLIDYAKKYNVEQLINFKHEKIIIKQAVFVKKHYISQVIYSEGDIYDPPIMKYTGVQTVRSDTPEFCRTKLVNLIDMIFNTLDREKAIEVVHKNKDEFQKQPGVIIASTKGLNKYEEYAYPTAEYLKHGVHYPLHCPIHIKAAIAYNYIIEKDKLPLQPAYRGAKIKYIYVNENNPAQTNAIGFIGQWPAEFNKYFKIDYDLQFEKTFMPIIDDLFKLLGWEEINYEENILEEILS